MIKRTGLAPWEFEFPFPGSLTSTLQVDQILRGRYQVSTQREQRRQADTQDSAVQRKAIDEGDVCTPNP